MRLEELARAFDEARKAFSGSGGLGVSHSMGHGSVVRLPRVLGLREDGYGNAIPGMASWIRSGEVEAARRGGFRIVLTTRNFWLARPVAGSWRSGSREQFLSAAAYGYATEESARADVERVAGQFERQDAAELAEREARKSEDRATRLEAQRQEVLAKCAADEARKELAFQIAREAQRRGYRASSSPNDVMIWVEGLRWVTGTVSGDLSIHWSCEEPAVGFSRPSGKRIETAPPAWVAGFLASRK